MTEPERKKLPPEMCPRCHGVKEPEDRLCPTCLKKEEEFIAERTTTDNPGVYETALSKTEVVVLSGLIFAAMGVFVGFVAWKVTPQIKDMMDAYGPPETNELVKVIMLIGGGLFADFILLMILLSFWKSYRKSLLKQAAGTGVKAEGEKK